MSAFKIAFVGAGATVIDNVFLDERDGWVLFRALTSGGPEVLRVNRDQVLYVTKLEDGAK